MKTLSLSFLFLISTTNALLSQEERYSFTGLSQAGGVFTTSENSNALPELTVGAPTVVGANASIEANGANDEFFRLVATSPIAVNDSIEVDFTFAAPTTFTLSTEGTESAINDGDIVTFIANGVSLGFAWCAINLDAPNTRISITTTHVPGDTVVIRGNGQGDEYTVGLFSKFRIMPSQPLSSFTARLTAAVPRSIDVNSSRFSISAPVNQPVTLLEPTIERGVQLSWLGRLGCNYQVQRSTTLQPGDWMIFGDSEIGTGQQMSIFDPFGSDPRAFYRIIETCPTP